MSDIQLYLLEYDKNKREASRLAQQSAESESSPHPTLLPHQKPILTLPTRTTEEGTEAVGIDRVARRIC